MKASEVVVGGLYLAKVSGKLTTVMVESCYRSPVSDKMVYQVKNMNTLRRTVFRSAAKFRTRVNEAI